MNKMNSLARIGLSVIVVVTVGGSLAFATAPWQATITAVAQDAPPAKTPEQQLAEDREAACKRFDGARVKFDQALVARDGSEIAKQALAMQEQSGLIDEPRKKLLVGSDEQRIRFDEAQKSIEPMTAALNAVEQSMQSGRIAETDEGLVKVAGYLRAAEPALKPDLAQKAEQRISKVREALERTKLAAAERKIVDRMNSDVNDARFALLRERSASQITGAEAVASKSLATLNSLTTLDVQSKAEAQANIDKLLSDVEEVKKGIAAEREKLEIETQLTGIINAVDEATSKQDKTALADMLKRIEGLKATINKAQYLATSSRTSYVASAERVRGQVVETTKRLKDAEIGVSVQTLTAEFNKVRGALASAVEGQDCADRDALVARAKAAAAAASAAVKGAQWSSPANRTSAEKACEQNDAEVARLAARLAQICQNAANNATLEADCGVAEKHLADGAYASMSTDVKALTDGMAKSGITPAGVTSAKSLINRLKSSIKAYEQEPRLTAIRAFIAAGQLDEAQGKIDECRSELSKSDALVARDIAAIGNTLKDLQGQVDDLRRAKNTRNGLIAAVAVIALMLVVAAVRWPRKAPPVGPGATGVTPPGGGGVTPPPPPPPGGDDLRLLFAARMAIHKKVQALNEELRRVDLSSDRKSSVLNQLSRNTELEASPITVGVPGASPPPTEWAEFAVVALQLANLGLSDQARDLLATKTVSNVIPKPMGPGAIAGGIVATTSSQVRINNGSRAVECALVWRAIVDASPDVGFTVTGVSAPYGQSQPSAVNAVSEVRRYFQLAVDWLPNQEDIAVLLERARFERSQGAMEDAIKCLTDARNRFDGAIKLSDAMKSEVLVLSAELEMDKAGIRRLELDDSSAPVRIGSMDSQTLQSTQSERIEKAKEFLKQAGSAIESQPRYYQVEIPTTPGVVEYAPAHFRVQCAYSRLHLASNPSLAGQSIMQALGEHPAVSGEAVRVVFDVPKLQPSWSRLVLAGANLKLADRRVAQALRMRWVSLMLDLSESSQNLDVERKQLDRRDAAWLLCRYWLLDNAMRGTSEALNLEVLRDFTKRALKRAGADNVDSAWVLNSADDRSVARFLKQHVDGGDEGDTVKPPVVPPVIGGGWTPPPPPPPQAEKLPSNVLLVVQKEAALLEGRAVVNEVALYDPTLFAGDLSGHIAWIDLGGGKPARALGVFGHRLSTDYVVRLAPDEVDASSLYGQSNSNVLGDVQILGKLTFDGLPLIPPGFEVVLSGPAPSMYGGSQPATPTQGHHWKRKRVDMHARPTAARSPVTPEVKPDVIERSLYEISVVLAASVIDVHEGPNFTEPWRHIASYFVEQLGEAAPLVRTALDATISNANKAGLPIDAFDLGSSPVDVEFIKRLVKQLRCRESARRFDDIRAAWERLGRNEPALKVSMDRLLRKYAAEHKAYISAAALEVFGIKGQAQEIIDRDRLYIEDKPKIESADPPTTNRPYEIDFQTLCSASARFVPNALMLYSPVVVALERSVGRMISCLEQAEGAAKDPARRGQIASALEVGRALRAQLRLER